MTTYILKRPNGSFDIIQEPPDMEKWQFQKWKWKVTQDGSELINSLDPEFKKYNNLINKQMKVSKVKAVQANGTWDSNYGTMYKFEYVMEDGQVVNANHKENKHLDIGTEVEYEITNADYNNGKVKKYSPEYSAGNRQGNGDNLKGIKIGHAITNAVSLVCALGHEGYANEFDAIKAKAKAIYVISEELNNEL